MADAEHDQWARWLLQRRFGGDRARRETVLRHTHGPRDRVLDNAEIVDGDVLLDIGCGDGLIGFGAIPRVGPSGTVLFSDVSQDMLDYCQKLAREEGMLERCRFVRASADDLSQIPSASVDVVTTRSVLIYVKEKERAFQEFYRVLKPRGRLSIFEPIARFFGYPPPAHLFGWQTFYDVTPIIELAGRVQAVYTRVRGDESPMMDFGERDLVAFAETAGFAEISLHLDVTIAPARPLRGWDARWHGTPNPLAPTLAEAVAEALDDEEAVRFVAHIRPLMINGQGQKRSAGAYLHASKQTTARLQRTTVRGESADHAGSWLP